MSVHQSSQDTNLRSLLCSKCPLTLTLYVIAIEPLSYLIHHKMVQSLIKGIPLPRPRQKQIINGHFGDDSLLTLLSDKCSLDNIVDCIHIFCEAFGSKIKREKMQCYPQSQSDMHEWLAKLNGYGFQQAKYLSSLGFHG